MPTPVPLPTQEPQYGYTGREVRKIIGDDPETVIRFVGAVRDWCTVHRPDLVSYADELVEFAPIKAAWSSYRQALVADAIKKIRYADQPEFLRLFLESR